MSGLPYPRSLDGKVALVIGGAGGIGAAAGRMLAEGGAQVALTHRPGTRAREAAELDVSHRGPTGEFR